MEDSTRIRALIGPLLGRAAWDVALGYSTFITLEFGEPREVDGHTHGAWHIWVYGADWRLEERGRILAGSSDDREKQVSAVKRLEGLVLQAIDGLPPALDTILTFDDGVTLRLFATYSADMAHWLLIMPDGYVLQFGPGTTWSYRPGSEL